MTNRNVFGGNQSLKKIKIADLVLGIFIDRLLAPLFNIDTIVCWTAKICELDSNDIICDVKEILYHFESSQSIDI